MINETIEAVKRYISGERAYRNTEGITKFHRIQASQGYRDAAAYCMELLNRDNIRAEILSYPAREGVKYWTQSMFQEWNCKDARLELIFPETITLADFRADNLSIVQRSSPCDFRDHPAEVVMIEKGKRDSFQTQDLEQKIIFISEDPNGYVEWAAEKKVLGIITDYMSDVFVRQRNDLYDDKLFLSFTWMKQETDAKIFSYILTPRMGDRLRSICTYMENEYERNHSLDRYPKVRGFIDSDFKDGTMEDVSAVIPGQTEEEVVLLAHLCHAKACANDNASGCGGAIEIMKTLQELIHEKILPVPKRTIRMLLVPEVVGTYAYLASHEEELTRIKAGIDIDMIGRRQEGKCGLVGIMGVPDSTASFVQDLAAYIVEENSRDIATFNIGEYVTPVHTQLLNYVGGSDHYILCDPTVGIPCIIMMQWLDSNYHSSADTIDKLDPDILKKTCSIAAAYLYTLADLRVEDVWFIMNQGRERLAKQLLGVIKEFKIAEKSYATLKEQIIYHKETAIRAAEDYERFFSGMELDCIRKCVEKEKEYISDFADKLLAEYTDFKAAMKSEVYLDKKYEMVPCRLFKGPITFVGFSNSLSAEMRSRQAELKKRYPEFYGINSMNDFIVHRVDGKRTLLEIARGAAIEGRIYNPDYVYEYLIYLADAGLVSFL